jgi:hypothetical protein
MVLVGSGVGAAAVAVVVVKQRPRLVALLKKIDVGAIAKQAPAQLRAVVPAAHSLRDRIPGQRRSDRDMVAAGS